MRKQKITVLAALCAASSALHAQSSVTLYGFLDEGVNYVSNVQTGRANGALVGSKQFAIADGATGTGGSRWGLRGSEDLGAGLHANFTLENGFNLSTGALAQGGLEFGRQAFVGLADPYGQVTLGRQYSIVSDMMTPFSEAGEIPGHIGGNPDDFDDVGHSQRINNTIKFRSATFNGVTFGATYSLGEVPGSTGRNQLWAASVTFLTGPFSIGAGYLNARDPNISYFGTSGNSGPATSNNLGSFGSATTVQSNPVYAGFASATSLRLALAGVKYHFANASIGATYSHASFSGLGDTSAGPNTLRYSGIGVLNNGEVNATYVFTSAFTVNAGYGYTRKASVGTFGNATYHQGILSAAYFLSKRTELYLLAIYQKATGTDSLGQNAVASITQLTPSANNHQALVRLGIVQTF